jgi:hypothetical protein
MAAAMTVGGGKKIEKQKEENIVSLLVRVIVIDSTSRIHI